MNRKFGNFWSVCLSFALVFALGISPHAAYADTTDDEVVIQLPVGEPILEVPVPDQPLEERQFDELPPDRFNSNDHQEILPLVLAPVAAYGMSSTVVGAIIAGGLGWYVGSKADLFKQTVNDKQTTSSSTYGIQYTLNSYDGLPAMAGLPIQTSATKHMEEALVKTTADRIKNFGQNGNLRVYTSTVRPTQVMAVIDITSPMGGTVNRHLGNSLNGKLVTNSKYKNEWMDLSGYSIFLVSDKNTKQYFHAHFTPTRLVAQEIEYQRYNSEYDVQLFPSLSKNSKYLKMDLQWQTNKDRATNNRGLSKDPNDRYPSIIPYK